MNLLILNYEFPPFGGGAGVATRNLARELVQLGHQVTVLTGGGVRAVEEERRGGVKILRVPSRRKGVHDCGLGGAWSYLVQASNVLRDLRPGQFDLVHYFFGLPTGLLQLYPGAHSALPSVISLRGSDVPGYDPYAVGLDLIHRGLGPLHRHLWRKAHSVVALSDDLRLLARQTDPRVPIQVIPNGVDLLRFRPDPAPTRPFDSPPRLLCVARLVRRKGIDLLLHAIAELKRERELCLSIVGTGPEERPLKQLTGSLQLEEQVTFRGFVPRQELAGVYRAHDVMVLPSRAESFGMAFVEAMACGLPVIGSRVGGLPELVREENGLLVEPGDKSSLVAAIRSLCEAPHLRIEMGQNNRVRTESEYSWRRRAEQYCLEYERICGLTASDERLRHVG